MTSREEKADFTINSAPVDITFTCPHCRWQAGVPFEDVDEPECWQDDWGSVERPHCGEEAESGERGYDRRRPATCRFRDAPVPEDAEGLLAPEIPAR